MNLQIGRQDETLAEQYSRVRTGTCFYHSTPAGLTSLQSTLPSGEQLNSSTCLRCVSADTCHSEREQSRRQSSRPPASTRHCLPAARRRSQRRASTQPRRAADCWSSCPELSQNGQVLDRGENSTRNGTLNQQQSANHMVIVYSYHTVESLR